MICIWYRCHHMSLYVCVATWMDRFLLSVEWACLTPHKKTLGGKAQMKSSRVSLITSCHTPYHPSSLTDDMTGTH